MPFLGQFRSLTPTQRNTFAACFLGWTLDAFDFFLLTFCLTAIAADFHVGRKQVEEAIFWTLAMRPVGAFLFGAMAEKYGRRPTLMATSSPSPSSNSPPPSPPPSTASSSARALRHRHGRRLGRRRSARPRNPPRRRAAASSPACSRKATSAATSSPPRSSACSSLTCTAPASSPTGA
jgi:hypothetical protein